MGLQLITKNESIKMTGNVSIIKSDIFGNVREIKEYKNILTNLCFDFLCNKLIDSGSELGITYMAIGSGTTAASVTDIALVTETMRKVLTSRVKSAQTAIFSMYLSTTEGNGLIREIGLFGGLASSTPNSGTLFDRLLINETKVNTETWTIEITFSFTN
ncbi:MAG: hypothetical protein ACYCXQ_01025 [Candidatus Humimicrobiaceae bacterium]